VSTGAEITLRGNGAGRGARDRKMFADVVRAHHRWDLAQSHDNASRNDLRTEFADALTEFEGEIHGRVVDAYWSQKRASGVVLAEVYREGDLEADAASGAPGRPRAYRRALRWLRLWHPIPEYAIYRETDWLTGEYPKLANLLHQCDVLAIKARWGLEGIHEAVVIPWLMAVEVHVLGYIERNWGSLEAARADAAHPADANAEDRAAVAAAEVLRTAAAAERERVVYADADAFYHDILAELNRIEDYYQEAGEKQGRLHYLTGMLVFGVLGVLLTAFASAGLLAVFGLLDLHSLNVRSFYASMAAGAVGAIVSVVMRMSRRGGGGFNIDHELGAAGVRRLGAFRPLIGAVSGVVLSLLVQTSLIPIAEDQLTLEFYAVVGFLAGFSERWTRVVLDGAMRTIEKPDAGAETTHGSSRPAVTRADQHQ
jgi:hypothetical protein